MTTASSQLLCSSEAASEAPQLLLLLCLQECTTSWCRLAALSCRCPLCMTQVLGLCFADCGSLLHSQHCVHFHVLYVKSGHPC